MSMNQGLVDQFMKASIEITIKLLFRDPIQILIDPRLAQLASLSKVT